MVIAAHSPLSKSIGFPEPTLEIESKLQEIVEDFLHSDETVGNGKICILPPETRAALHYEFYQSSRDPSKESIPFFGQKIEKPGISPSLKAAIITNYVRKTLFGKDLEMAKSEFAALKGWSEAIDYPAHSQEGRKPETLSFTHARLYPYDATRVHLSDGSYINANHVLEKYILTQSPVNEGSPEPHTSSKTVNPFWQMIDEYQVHTIVMLNGEPGLFYFPYFPHTLGETLTFRGRSITLLKEEHSTMVELDSTVRSVSDRTLSLKTASGEHRTVHHLKANHWGDFTAGDHTTIQKLIDLIRKYQGREDSLAPTVIHCRSGVGRAGQFTLSLHLEQAARKGQPYSLSEALKTLRDPETGRSPAMVQGEGQYLSVTRFLKNLK